MKKLMFYGVCVLFVLFFLGGAAFAEDKMIIFFKDGRTQSFDLNSIQKIEYQTTPGAYQRTTEKGIPVTI
ncbi:MAG: hypothetical protein N2596_03090, partial [Syntrophorhabdaceae bacterium]|nr:hypothetical protein [Syntrophorhabdaceae bacterium]